MASNGRYYVIGDVNGRANALRRAFTAVHKDMRDFPDSRPTVVMTGNYFGYGSDSREVVRLINREKAAAEKEGFDFVTLTSPRDLILRGVLNSENKYRRDFFLAYMKDYFKQSIGEWNSILSRDSFVTCGQQKDERTRQKREVLLFLLKETEEAVRGADFILNPTYSRLSDEFFFCHGEVNLGKPLEEQSFATLSGVTAQSKGRNDFSLYNKGKIWGKTVVHTDDFRHSFEGADVGDGRITLHCGNPETSKKLSLLVLKSGKTVPETVYRFSDSAPR